ncbi:MAG: hypothetical protein ACRC1D_03530 [Culicoidibacterales bacterium]
MSGMDRSALFYEFLLFNFSKMNLQIVEKCFAVGYVSEWGSFRARESVYAKTPGKAKLKFDNYNDEPFVKIKAVREKEHDWVIFEGRKVKRHIVDSTMRDRAAREEIQDFVAKNQGKQVLIFSGQWEAYWRSDGAGYTQKKADAGIYEINDAWSRVSHCGSEKAILFILVS